MDGSCVATTHVENTSLQPPAGVKDGDAFHDVWVWNYLETSNMGEVRVIFFSHLTFVLDMYVNTISPQSYLPLLQSMPIPPHPRH